MNVDTQDRQNGIFVLSDDGKIYRIKFKSVLTQDTDNEEQTVTACFPQYVYNPFIFRKSNDFSVFLRKQSKDTSKIVRCLFFNCNPSNLVSSILFFTVNFHKIFLFNGIVCEH